MVKVRFGIVGLGNMGSAHASQLLAGKIARAELTAVADVDAARSAPYSALERFEDAETMFGAGVIDAVLIATPHYSHTTLGIAALERGLHALIEKPISVHKADCERLIAAHSRTGSSAFTDQAVQMPLDGAAYEKKLKELAAGSRKRMAITPGAPAGDFSRSFH